MIDFRNKDSIASSFLAVLSIVLLLGGLGFYLWFTGGGGPTTKGLAKRTRQQELKILENTKSTRERLDEAKATVATTTWSETPEKVAPLAFARLSALASKYKVKLTALRPQRANEGGDLIAMPFLLSLQGPFASIVQMVREVESPTSKLAVKLIQVNASDSGTDAVTANVGIMAYLKPKSTAATKTTTLTQGGTNRA